MGIEIERKFLVSGRWSQGIDMDTYLMIHQGYLSLDPERTVRVREVRDTAPDLYRTFGYLTVKGKSYGIERVEYEYEIPSDDARKLLGLCVASVVEKCRYRVGRFEVDRFMGVNNGLMVAEIELQHADETFEKPSWLGVEVSDDPKYFNSNLATNPYVGWK